MEKQYIDVNSRDTIPWTALRDENESRICLPLLAICLDLVPVLIGRGAITSSIFLVMLLSPIVGMIFGIVSLNSGKNRILSTIAIVLPLAFVVFIGLSLNRARAGTISSM